MLDLATRKRELWLELGPLDRVGLVRSVERTNLTPDGRSYCYTVTHLPSDLCVNEGLR
jgi:hypothetical protein